MADRTLTTQRRMLWVYGLDLPRDRALTAIAEPVERWDENDERVPWPLGVAIGTEYLDHDCVEPAFIDDLGKPLSNYLQAMTRADAALFASNKDRLDAATGMIILVSRDPKESDLSRTPHAPFTFLGVYPQEPYSFSLRPMPEKPVEPPEPRDKLRVDVPQASSKPKDITRRNILTAAFVFGIVGLVMILAQLVR